MWTHEQLSALKAAAAKGVRSVSYDGQTVTYQSVAEMLKLIAMMERELSPARARMHHPAFERGTD